MGYLGRRIGLSQDTGNSSPTASDVGGGILDLFAQGYFQRQGNIYNNPAFPPSGLTATGGEISDYSDSGTVYRAHIFTSSGTFDVTAPGTFGDTVEYLVVAGGGGGGSHSTSGGGGAGGVRTNLSGHPFATSVTFPVNPGSFPAPFSVSIGAGGAGGGSYNNNGVVGGDSSFGPITSKGGGYGAKDQTDGGDGGSGGGAGGSSGSAYSGGSTLAVTTPSPWPGPSVQGSAGGDNRPVRTSPYTSGGGGGAGGAGGTGGTNSGDGGIGIQVHIAGPPTNTGVGHTQGWFAAGGGGAAVYGGSVGSGGIGGGGDGVTSAVGNSGELGTGSGGGASAAPGTPGNPAGNGGSGIVIVRYQIASVLAAKATGGAISFTPTKTIHTFTSSGTFTAPSPLNPSPLSVEYLVVGGGGGGGVGVLNGSGGGGAGGMLEHPSFTVTSGSSISVQVGGGGAGGFDPTTYGATGTPSYFSSPEVGNGGGGGGSGYAPGTTPNNKGQPGGSGGGSGSNNTAGSATQTPSPGGGTGYGNAGGNVTPGFGTGGGGGGAGGVGDSDTTNPNAGGAGRANSISGTSVTYAAGGDSTYPTTYSSEVSPGFGNGGPAAGPTGNNGNAGIVLIAYPT